MHRLNHLYSLRLVLALSLCLLILAACNNSGNNTEPTRLARVGNTYLTVEEARAEIPEFVYRQDSTQALLAYREEWIQNQVVLQEAERLRLRQNENVRNRLRQAQQEVLSQALKDYVLSEYNENLEVTDEEARNYYQAHKDQFILNERYVQFRHVETADLESARAAKRAIMQGRPWEEVAREYSINPEAKIRASNQYLPISMAMADINIMNRYLNIIGQTEISPIQRVGNTYHFVQLMDSRAQGEHPDLEWLIEQIKDWLLLDKRRRHFSSYLKNLYLKAKSNNEIESFNVLTTNSNPNEIPSDTLETTTPNE